MGIDVVPTDNLDNSSDKPGTPQPNKIPIAIAIKIQSVKNLSKKTICFWVRYSYKSLHSI